MVWNPEQSLEPTSIPTPDNTQQFIDAIKSLLDECDMTALNVLADRLSPFEISFKQVVLGNTVSIKPVLVLVGGQPPLFDTLESFCPGYFSPSLSDSTSNQEGSTGDSLQSTRTVGLSRGVTTDHAKIGLMNGMPFDEDLGEIGGRNLIPAGIDISETGGSRLYRSSTQGPRGDGSPFSVPGIETFDFSFSISPNYFIAANLESVQDTSDENSMGQPTHHAFGDCHIEDGNIRHVSVTNVATSSELNCNPPASMMAGRRWLDIPPDKGRSRTESGQVASSLFSAGQLNASSPVPGAVCSDNASRNEKSRREGQNGVPSAATTPKLVLAARTCIRADYIQFLETNRLHWSRDGLWGQTWPPSPMASLHEYDKLQKAYSCVCRLDRRMGGDQIRSRMAMISLHLEYEKIYCEWKAQNQNKPKIATRVGRGETSSMIDNILANIHPEWKTSDDRGKAELRGSFHDRKRYGKRWWILVKTLGPGILVLCSSKFAGLIKNTTITARMLTAVAHTIQVYELDVMRVLMLINPIAESLFRDQGYESHDWDQLLDQLAAVGLNLGKDAESQLG